MNTLARHAGVSPQTVYNTVGDKAEVLKGVWDTMLAGDFDQVSIIARPAARAAWSTPDGRRCLALYATLGREIYERVAPLVPVIYGAAGSSAAVRAVIAGIDNEHAIGTRMMAAHCAERFGLRADLTVDQAAALLWTMTAPEVADRLVRRRGWSLEAYETWLGRAMADAILQDP